MLVLMAVVAIIAGTMVARSGVAERRIVVQLFSQFQTGGTRNEAWRLLVMNILLFFPLGLTMPHILPTKWSCRKILLVVALAGFGLSLCIEVLQYVFAVGVAELDDLLCNTIGAVLGCLHIFVSRLIWRLKNSR